MALIIKRILFHFLNYGEIPTNFLLYTYIHVLVCNEEDVAHLRLFH